MVNKKLYASPEIECIGLLVSDVILLSGEIKDDDEYGANDPGGWY